MLAALVYSGAAITDLLDGYLARKMNVVSVLGKFLDPLADKLLLFATLVPIYWITHYRMREYAIPWWGSLPLWVAVLLVGREVFMTVLRQVARRRGVVIAAAGAGKLKTIVQDIFIGATIGWFAWKDMAAVFGWTGWWGRLWGRIHGAVVAVTLATAVLLTVYSLGVYLYRYRGLFRRGAHPAGGDGS